MAELQLNPAKLAVSEGIKGVLHQLLHQVLRRPCRVHGSKTVGADRQPAVAIGAHLSDPAGWARCWDQSSASRQLIGLR